MGDVEKRRSSTPTRARLRAARLCAAALTAIVVCAAGVARGAESDAASREGAASTAAPSVTSPRETRDRRLVREERPLWRRALALPADVLEATFWPLRQTLFWMERDDVPGRMRDAAVHPLGALAGAAAEEDLAR